MFNCISTTCSQLRDYNISHKIIPSYISIYVKKILALESSFTVCSWPQKHPFGQQHHFMFQSENLSISIALQISIDAQ